MVQNHLNFILMILHFNWVSTKFVSKALLNMSTSNTKKATAKKKEKTDEKRFLTVSLIVTVALMAILYFVFRNAF